MINRELLNLLKEDKKYIWGIVFAKWLSLMANISLTLSLCAGLATYVTEGALSKEVTQRILVTLVIVLVVKYVSNRLQQVSGHYASSRLRLEVRQAVLHKSTGLGIEKTSQLSGTELTQLSVEGVEQLEHYFSRFIPQLFYCLVATVTVFMVLVRLSFQPAIVLLLCIPLIPLSIMAIMKLAKRILGEYWDGYLLLGEQFYENLMGLTTLKVFRQDGKKQQEMDERAESFRRATMNLLSMQLNSLIVMDIVAYGGAALGIFLALNQFQLGHLSLEGLLIFILLGAEFFIPLRQLGSFFHVAMNGMSASKRLFRYLEAPVAQRGNVTLHQPVTEVILSNVSFSYDEQRKSLSQITTRFEKGHLYGIIGQSGSGKSTLSRLIVGDEVYQEGYITMNGLSQLSYTSDTLKEHVVVVNQRSYLFEGTILDNLLMGNPNASEVDIWSVLEQVSLTLFVSNLPDGLETQIVDNGKAFSGGQRQRLVVARALLSKRSVYVFDEITSSVDRESELAILEAVREVSRESIVLFISHRLYTVKEMDYLLIFDEGQLVDQGTPEYLEQHSERYHQFLEAEAALLGGGK